ncbi:MAG TPA: twin-arginine translocation signal domain-containing protein, partial [Alphaproteobacteria bacterium]|nr:twin-arginine translocation signal domain-containing protein [Alphaproteobacteria bacterium]
MKVEIYNLLSRRTVLKGGAAVTALAIAGCGEEKKEESASTEAAPAAAPAPAEAPAGDLRKQLLQIPGVGKGSPTDADWQKVGELCLGATKANVAEGEFKGVELTFMGLNNQNL